MTVAPAEWKSPLHECLFKPWSSNRKLSDVQGLLTIHMYHTLVEAYRKLSTLCDAFLLPYITSPLVPSFLSLADF